MALHEPHEPNRKHAHAPPFCWPVRVYYEDTDAGGVVYYANYLRFLERARSEWLRALGVEQTALATEHNVVFVVRSIALDYQSPARFNEALTVTVEPGEIGASQLFITQRVLRGGVLLVQAHVRIACVNLTAFSPVRIPKPVRSAMAAGVGKT